MYSFILPTRTWPDDIQSLTSREELVRCYFEEGLTYKEILQCLAASHAVVISLRTLKRIVKRMNLRRRMPFTKERALKAIEGIQKHLRESGQCLGYKAMYRRLQKEGLIVGRDQVRFMLKGLDIQGVNDRARRRLKRRQYVNPGPNFVWHIDGYDKLKPYGFAIHGAIDGFSRRVIWLQVGVTNNDPKVIMSYFIDAVRKLQCIPTIIRSDHGTENGLVEDLQIGLRSQFNDTFCGRKSFRKGKSSSNQRIERWWGILRQQCVNFWMNLFKDLISLGILDNGDPLHINALRFCFMDLIEADIHRCAKEWNEHRIQPRKNREGPAGKPNLLFFHPELVEATTHSFPADLIALDEIQCELEANGYIPPQHDPTFTRLVNVLVPDWKIPENVDEGLGLYGQIIDSLRER